MTLYLSLLVAGLVLLLVGAAWIVQGIREEK